MAGAIKYQEMLVSDVMTDASEVFMLPWDATLSFKMLREIFQTGFSRIPVHGPSGRDEIIGLIFVKDLIFVDPEDETPVKRFAEILFPNPRLSTPTRTPSPPNQPTPWW